MCNVEHIFEKYIEKNKNRPIIKNFFIEYINEILYNID